jgi:glucan phosphoethanolaminetransferase (alkaline phosphatase superfamily)
MKERNSKQKLIALAIAAAVLMNIPILETVNKPILLLGFPLLYLYIFTVWLIIIIILFRLSRHNPS